MNGLRLIQRKKPDFCELYLTSGGKLFFLKEENNEGFIEDDLGEMVTKLSKKRGSFKDWFGKMFPENTKSPRTLPSSSSTSLNTPPMWENSVEEIEEYFNRLLESNAEEHLEAVHVSSQSTEPDIPKDLVTFIRFRATSVQYYHIDIKV